jgi:hypothetical protein
MEDREAKIEAFARAAYDATTFEGAYDKTEPERRAAKLKEAEVGLVAAGFIPPKPAPTAGQRIAEGMVTHGTDHAFIAHPTNRDRALEVHAAPGEGNELAPRLREWFAAACDEAVRLDRAARPAPDYEEVAEEFVRVADPNGVYVGDWRIPESFPDAFVPRVRKHLVALMRRAMEGGQEK